MKIHATQYTNQMNTLLHVWTTSNANRSFSGLSFTEAKMGLQPSLDARARVAAAQTELALAIRDRDAADVTTYKMYKRAIGAIQGDPVEYGKEEILEVIKTTARKTRRTSKATTPPTGSHQLPPAPVIEPGTTPITVAARSAA